jgi:hypothetical protein
MNGRQRIFNRVPLWIVILIASSLMGRYWQMRNRPGNVRVRMRTPTDEHWISGNAVWMDNVFAFRSLPAAWRESLVPVRAATTRNPVGTEAEELHRLERPVIASFFVEDDRMVEVAVPEKDQARLLGPFAPDVAASQTGATSEDVAATSV